MAMVRTVDKTPGSLKPRVLLYDNQVEERKALSVALLHDGFEVQNINEAGISQLRECGRIDAVISNLSDPRNGSGIRLVRSWRTYSPQTPVIAIVADDAADPTDEALRAGAVACLPQPVRPEKLTASLRRVLSIRRGDPESPALTTTSDDIAPAFEGMIGRSRVMRRLFEQVDRVAPTNSTVLISGSTGTGKELLAQAIQRLSRRSDKRFIAVNVAAVPSTLIESELFGHVKGAFTDAVAERMGRFEAADGGTLFIDEIGDLKLESQAKLLRVLECRAINRVGSNEDIPIDVRVLAATSRNLESMVATNQFRPDLYYRLNVVRLELPELRERPEDIPLLVSEFLSMLAAQNNETPKRVDLALMEYFQSHPWPGNIRQLKNCLESMLVMADDEVLTKKDLPHTEAKQESSEGLENLPLAGCRLADLERQTILQTLKQNGGSRSQTADMLGISVRTLQRKLKEWEHTGIRRGIRADVPERLV